ncbi:MAG: HAMP domain-containing sensor histidine kinase [Pseudomonadota bacterium]
MAFRFPRPRSITALVLLGYAMIMLPLSIALGWTLLQLDRFATRSQSLIVSGVEATQNTRELQEQLSIMERVARQYLVAEDQELAEFLRADSDTIAEVTTRLKRYAEDVQTRAMLGRIDLAVEELVSALPEGSGAVAGAIGRFIDAGDAARALEVQFQEGIDRQVFALKADAADTRTALIWQAGVLGGFSIFTMIFVTWRVSRPIRVLDRAINQLGEGRFSHRIEVVGPADLVALGRQLEWLRQRLLELAQEKNRFLRHMSHELKTPLANIREGTELLLDGSVGQLDAPQEEVTDILRSNGIRLQRLIENLLNFSAWQSRNEVLTASEFPLRRMVESILKVHALTIRSQRIRLLTTIDDVSVFADREMIRTTLDNLISNAVKFSPEGGALFIRAQRTENAFVLEVADQGPGIPMSERKKVFDAFYQGEQQHGGLVAGTGIGLSVVLECVQAHDGVVEICDEQRAVRTGRGDTVVLGGAHFRIEIPQQAMTTKRVANG